MTTYTDLPIDLQDKISGDPSMRFKLMNPVEKNQWIKDTYGTYCCDEKDAIRLIDVCSPEGNVYGVIGMGEQVREVNNSNSPPFTQMLRGGFKYDEICLAVKYGTRGFVRVVDYRDE